MSSSTTKEKKWKTGSQKIGYLINKPGGPDTFFSRTWRTTSTPDLAIATDDIQGIAEREVPSQLGGSDHRPLIISIKGQTQSHRNKLPACWNYTKKTVGMLSERRWTGKLQQRNCHIPTSAGVLLFSTRLFLKQQRCSSQVEEWKAPRQSALLDPRAWQLAQGLRPSKREDGKLANKRQCRGTQQGKVEAHSRAKVQYTRARTQATRKSWHKKKASLNMEKDTTGLWNLTRALNNDNPPPSPSPLKKQKSQKQTMS